MSTRLSADIDLPDFNSISADDISPRIDALLKQLDERVEVLATREDHTFDSLVPKLEALRHELAAQWSPIGHLNMVRNEQSWQTAYLDALSKVTAFSATLSQDSRLHAAYERIAAAENTCTPAQRHLLEHTLREFRLAGVALDDADKQKFVALMQRLSKAQSLFANNLQRCMDEWQWHCTDAAAVAGIPANVLGQAHKAAEQADLDGWLFGLSQPVYQSVMTHAEDRTTRERFYRAWMTRATDSDIHNGEYDNSAVIHDILEARQALAELLNFNNYAEYSLAPKMADSVEEVIGFLDYLAERSKPAAENERNALEAMAGHPLAAWDTGYYAERFKERTFSVSDEQLRQYFQCQRVLDGMFALAERLYGIKLTVIEDVSVWHESVRFLQLRDAQGHILGGFYTDLFARPGKRSGAWIDECVIRKALPDETALPVGYLVCNFTAPSGDNDSQLTHNEMVTLFHEFGHMLHHLLTQVDYPSIAGINGVPWDAVELPSQFMENYAWEFEVLANCSHHCDTGETLPRQMFDRLHAARNANAGLQMLRQLEFALFDFVLHARSDAATPEAMSDSLTHARSLASVVPVPEWNRFENSFAHIFAGGYAAGYYSYKWAEVLAADAFAAFTETGNVFDQRIAQRFRQHILEIGGSRNIHDAFVEFRGRAPSIDALLVSNGIVAA